LFEEKMREEQQNIEKLKKELNIDELQRKSDALQKKKKDVDAKIVQMNELMKRLNLQSSSRAQLNLKRQEKKKKQEAIQSL
jgi:hypothetical protein